MQGESTSRTVYGLYPPAVVVRELEVLGVHPLVEGSHDGQRVVGVLQAQGVAQLVDRHQEHVVTCIERWGRERDGGERKWRREGGQVEYIERQGWRVRERERV